MSPVTTDPDIYVHRTLYWCRVGAAPARAVVRLARRVARRQPLLSRAGVVAAAGALADAYDVIDLSRLQPGWRGPVAVGVGVVVAVGWVWPAVTPVKDPRTHSPRSARSATPPPSDPPPDPDPLPDPDLDADLDADLVTAELPVIPDTVPCAEE